MFFSVIILSACKKDLVTKPVAFTSTSYQDLVPYNSLGEPDNLLKDTISAAMQSYVGQILIKGQNLTISLPELFTSDASANINITKKSDVYITFYSGDAAYSNAVAFYSYPSDKPPLTAADIRLITYVFPNAGHLTALNPGDKAEIGTFEPGTTIGFVIMQNAWDTTNHTLNNNAVHYCSTDALNPEVDPKLKRHAVLISYAPENKLLVSFEDQDRTSSSCDNDFDDVSFYTTVVAAP
jgi:hypothetical protein